MASQPQALAGCELAVHEVAGHGLTVARFGPAPQGQGDRRHIFFVHGMGDTAATWTALLPDLAGTTGATLWTFELPWSGRDGTDWPHVMPATDWWRAALERCPVAPDLCVGHSFGASVVLDWAGTLPAADACALLLVSPFYNAADQRVQWEDLDHFAVGVLGRLERALRARMGERPAPNDSVVSAMAHMLARRIVPDGLVEMFRLFLKSRRWPLKSLLAPVSLVVGTLDEPIVQRSVAGLASVLPHARVHRVAQCGHHPMQERPSAFAELLRDFAIRTCAASADGPMPGTAPHRLQPGGAPQAPTDTTPLLT